MNGRGSAADLPVLTLLHPRSGRTDGDPIMTIGRCAHASGLTVKALGLDDDTGLPEAREVDPVTWSRRYGLEQLRHDHGAASHGL